jgi:hypothetical protein
MAAILSAAKALYHIVIVYEKRVGSIVKSHLAFRIATVGGAGVGLDELANCESISGFLWTNSEVV